MVVLGGEVCNKRNIFEAARDNKKSQKKAMAARSEEGGEEEHAQIFASLSSHSISSDSSVSSIISLLPHITATCCETHSGDIWILRMQAAEVPCTALHCGRGGGGSGGITYPSEDGGQKTNFVKSQRRTTAPRRV